MLKHIYFVSISRQTIITICHLHENIFVNLLLKTLEELLEEWKKNKVQLYERMNIFLED